MSKLPDIIFLSLSLSLLVYMYLFALYIYSCLSLELCALSLVEEGGPGSWFGGSPDFKSEHARAWWMIPIIDDTRS
jgi:hypothetical protein